MYGWMGNILRVDLSNQTSVNEPLDTDTARKFIGGRGLNGITLYREVGPEVDPLSPENRLIFGAGPCNGTISLGSSRCNVTGKSPSCVYVCIGFCSVLVSPSPKLHSQDVIPSYEIEVSVKVTFKGSIPEVGEAEKLAIG